MQVKKLLAVGLTLSTLLGALSGLTACGEHTHELNLVAKKDATCTEAGYEAYYQCSGCEKIFSDEKGEKEIAKPAEIKAGHKIEAVDEKASTCKTEGTAAHYKCSVCNKLFSDAEGKNEITAPDPLPLAKHTLEYVSEKRSTCTEDGYEEHYKCSVCNKLFADEDGKEPLEKPTPIAAAHRLKPVPKKDATCVSAGYEAYWECTGECEKLYSDENAEHLITEPVAIQPTGIHTPGFAYTSETVPAPVAEGGTLSSKCAVCGADMGTVTYDIGHIYASGLTLGNALKLDNAGTYYAQLGETRGSYIGFQATKAGTYTLTFTSVFNDDNQFRYLDRLWITKDAYPTSTMRGYLMNSNSWEGAHSTVTAEEVAKYQQKVSIEGYVDAGKGAPIKSKSPLTKITFTLTDEDVADGGLYIAFSVSERIQDGTDACGVPTNNATLLIKFEAPEDTPQV